ncbi:hypothetical protein GJ744_009346 [Endocarpon pusillum]|uniref:Uncharacterized protein n=1 Tax=Endocarpon pusillum TaxID=364733 RepID=A0A8H7ANL8_9EURO|nr:hypothetical protein GJ744_009346 [Endocarpon pusillum]
MDASCASLSFEHKLLPKTSKTSPKPLFLAGSPVYPSFDESLKFRAQTIDPRPTIHTPSSSSSSASYSSSSPSVLQNPMVRSPSHPIPSTEPALPASYHRISKYKPKRSATPGFQGPGGS